MKVQSMTVEQSIHEKLTVRFSPVFLAIENQSHLHSGHHGSPGTGESHFHIDIVAKAFLNKSRIDCHRLVNETLAEELAGPIHALAIKARGP